MNNAGEIRQNRATGQWVIYAPSRLYRPNDFERPRKSRTPLPEYAPGCPFCPGNEAQLLGIHLETMACDGEGWGTRSVPNKFPALREHCEPDRSPKGLFMSMPGFGRHEVVVETPRHNHDLASMSEAEMSLVVETYHRRYLVSMDGRRHMLAILFRNHGQYAGASLAHPHSQLVVTPMVPRFVRWRENEAQRYFDELGRCVYCDIIASEQSRGERVVSEEEPFIALVPFAAEVPYEIWILPRSHQADFGRITEKEKGAFSRILQRVLRLLKERLDDPDYNYVIHSAPRFKGDEPQLHWYLQIQPRLTNPAGFEMGSGIRINPSMPEEDAKVLRGQAIPANPFWR